jgi:2Fe-2S ferredoxin
MLPATPGEGEVLVRVLFRLTDGHTLLATAAPGDSVMDCALDNAVPGIRGQCGGGCTCGTCHCYVGAPWRQRVAPPDSGEDELLDFLPARRSESRLACRIVLTDALDGIEVTVAPANE